MVIIWLIHADDIQREFCDLPISLKSAKYFKFFHIIVASYEYIPYDFGNSTYIELIDNNVFPLRAGDGLRRLNAQFEDGPGACAPKDVDPGAIPGLSVPVKGRPRCMRTERR